MIDWVRIFIQFTIHVPSKQQPLKCHRKLINPCQGVFAMMTVWWRGKQGDLVVHRVRLATAQRRSFAVVGPSFGMLCLAASVLNSLLCLCLSSAAVWRPSFLIMVWFCLVGSASEELLLKRRYINWRLRLRLLRPRQCACLASEALYLNFGLLWSPISALCLQRLLHVVLHARTAAWQNRDSSIVGPSVWWSLSSDLRSQPRDLSS